ncbi:MAG: tetratricopeptide repeat protein [Saccharothrix sp.]|nr:tetratricopeptide repeat protein [Saccharothrix sp.]
MVEFRVLGRLEVRVGGRLLDVGHAKRRCVAAVLLAEANRVVTTEQLLERVWAGRPPHKARQAVSNYVSQLRQLLAGAVEGGPTIRRRDEGYTLLVDPDQVDLHLFRRLAARARAETDQGRALELWEQADRLWRGEAFEGLDTPWLVACREGLARERFAADSDRVDLALARGRHAAVLPELTTRAAAHPLDERVAAQLVLALYRDGRQADALARYQDIRTRLADELGTDPGPDLRELHHRILTADAALTPPARTARVAGAPVPRQLPAPPHPFTGRAAELARLDQALATRTADAVVISAIGGAGGIGKTWLALHWAHRNADRFPDGQLFVDLHGFSHADRPVTPDAALFGFLVALGVAPDRVPADQDAKAALYRSLVADQRVLVVLDNAATADQVVPLLPGTPSCTVLITGRTRLASLIDRSGTRHLQLDVLTAAEARELLTSRVRLAAGAEPDATAELVALCGAYPLALSIAARNAATRPTVPLAEIAAELRELGLDGLDHDTDPAASLPAVMSWSLRRLTDRQRTLFGLLGIAPGPDTTLAAAAVLTGLPKSLARKDLSALEDASLVERRPGGRYVMHDLIREYAATTADALPDDLREPALVRLVDFHLHTACAADRLLNPQRVLLRPDPPAPGVDPHPLPDAAAAMAWMEAEHATLLATQRTAAALGRHGVVWHLAWVLDTFHYRRGRLRDALGSWQAALDAAEHLPDPTTRSRTHRLLGHTCSRLDRNEEATEHMNRALALAVRHDDPAEQAHTHRTLATVWARRGDDRRALDHAGHALDLYRTLDEPVRQADALNLMGWYAARLGDHDTAREHCLAALTLHRHHRDPDGEASTLDSLGLIAHRTGEHRQAVDHYDQALTLLRGLGNSYEVAETLDNIGHPHAALGHHDQALSAWREALFLYRDQGRDTEAERVRRQLATLRSEGDPHEGS